jgi:hypothetical protein
VDSQEGLLSDECTYMKENEIKSRCKRLDIRLKTRCAGLLEIHDTESPISSGLYTVNYIRRTARDFLDTDKGQAILKEIEIGFNSNISILTTCLLKVKGYVLFKLEVGNVGTNNSEIWNLVIRAMQFAKRAHMCGNNSYVAVLDTLDRVILRMWSEQREAS